MTYQNQLINQALKKGAGWCFWFPGSNSTLSLKVLSGLLELLLLFCLSALHGPYQ